MDTLPVTLIVKAPNQQFEDQTIKCEPNWSIRKLKGYLSEHYPCNPTLDEQKLIYSGQLLNDAHILKDVLRQYEGQDTHTVHLVYTPKRPIASSAIKNSNAKSTVNSEERHRQPSQSHSVSESSFLSDGLRQRSSDVNSNSQTPPQNATLLNNYLNPSQSFMPTITFNQPNADQPQIQYTPEQYAMAQQMAMQNMMHQMYIQYMNQYAASMQTIFGNVNTYGASNDSRPQPQPQPQVQHDAAAAAAVQPPRLQAAADEEAENRDWLEILYTLSRLLVLLSLVYFYSSPVRCMIVIFAFVLYYLYQSHQRNLRDRQQLEAAAGEPDDISAENVQEPNANGETEERNDSYVPNSESESSEPLTSGIEQEENRLPTITLLRTFILSFFSSLIPETPAV